MVTLKQLRFVPAFALLAAGLAACAGDGPTVEQRYPTESKYGGRTDPSGRSDQTGIFGKDTLSIDLFGGKDESSSGGGIGVNGYLWRASLDTLAFMPLVSADPFGGVIITDWYSAKDSPGERVKMTVYILDTRLRADGIRVSVFRQQRSEEGTWVDGAIDPATPTKIENAILTRARELRVETVKN